MSITYKYYPKDVSGETRRYLEIRSKRFVIFDMDEITPGKVRWSARIRQSSYAVQYMQEIYAAFGASLFWGNNWAPVSVMDEVTAIIDRASPNESDESVLTKIARVWRKQQRTTRFYRVKEGWVLPVGEDAEAESVTHRYKIGFPTKEALWAAFDRYIIPPSEFIASSPTSTRLGTDDFMLIPVEEEEKEVMDYVLSGKFVHFPIELDEAKYRRSDED